VKHSGIKVGKSFDLKTDKSGKQVMEKKSGFAGLSFQQRLAKKAKAKKPRLAKGKSHG